jgi:hypothetical protein
MTYTPPTKEKKRKRLTFKQIQPGQIYFSEVYREHSFCIGKKDKIANVQIWDSMKDERGRKTFYFDSEIDHNFFSKSSKAIRKKNI